MIEIAERVIPGLRENIKFLETATPGDAAARFTRNAGGAMYGWEHTPNQVGTRRLPHATPIDGLLLSGLVDDPGLGLAALFASGVHTAAMILREAGRRPAVAGRGAAAAREPARVD